MTTRKEFFKLLCFLLLFCAVPVFAQTFSVLADFVSPQEGGNNLVQAADGNLYGTTIYGGPSDSGTVYRISPSGTMTTIYNFCAAGGTCTDGAEPFFGLTLGADGNLYGTTNQGGANNDGTVFKITLNGTLTTLHSFDGGDGCTPQGGVMLANNGFFYGTTLFCGTGAGTLFAFKPGGSFRTLYQFRSNSLHGGNPYTVPIQASDGNLYGVTYAGGSSGLGVFYKVTPSNTVSNIYNFCSVTDCADGASPLGGLVEGSDGNLYGTVTGANNCCGAIFRLTTSGTETILHYFSGGDGSTPIATLALGNDGVMYSTTPQGGSGICSGGCGTIYSITTGGAFTSLYDFCVLSSCLDGYYSGDGPLFQDTNGTFYDTNAYGGTDNVGTVFTWSEGLPAFVTPSPAAGAVGSKVTILGNSLAGATSVSFNGTPATFTASNHAIRTTVPAGATTGTITVTLPSSTLTSKINFTVMP